MTTTIEAPRVRTKSFHYQTRIEWLAETAGRLEATDRPPLRITSPPEFKGETGTWTPEDMLVGAVESCLMATFLAFARHRELDLISYRSEADGLLESDGEGMRFTRITIRPTIRIARADQLELADRLIEKAHDKCLIARSLNSEVTIEPRIEAS